jgi:hypothetical protein
MSRPQRIQYNRFADGPLPATARLVTRSSRYGNPFAVRQVTDGWRVVDLGGRLATLREEPLIVPTKFLAATVAVRLYAENIAPGGLYPFDKAAVIRDLGGYDLACACPLTIEDVIPWPCHGGVLLELANPRGSS